MNQSDEREFLHDLASPLGTAIFLTDVVLERIQNKVEVPSEAVKEEIQRIGQIYESLNKISKMLQERREILIKRGVSGAGASGTLFSEE